MNADKIKRLAHTRPDITMSVFIGFVMLCCATGMWDCSNDSTILPTHEQSFEEQTYEASASTSPTHSRPTARPTRVAGVDGTRVFWIQTSILSNSGGSGYVHFCPGGVFYTSSEGSFLLQGAGGAHTSRGAGAWRLTQNRGYPYVTMQFNDGSSGGYWVGNLTSGRSWRMGQTKYAAEQGRATCP